MNFKDWSTAVPEEIKGDVLWTVKAYQLALFLADRRVRMRENPNSQWIYQNLTTCKGLITDYELRSSIF